MKFQKTRKFVVSTFIIAGSVTTFTFAQKTENYKTEQININHFHLVDFIGWNNNMQVLANYHTKDVKVFGDGWSTVGMRQHEESLQPMLKQTLDMKIGQHSPNVARKEWTGVVGTSYPGKSKMATIAKWKDGLIAEEYLFMKQLSEAEISKINLSSKVIVKFESPNDKALQNSVDIQPGWSCTMAEIDGKRTAIFTKNENGKITEKLIFQ